MPDTDNHVAYVEDADSDGNPIDDTKTYVSTAHSIKEEANVSRTRRDKGKDRLRRKESSSPAANHHTDSDSTAHPRSPLKRDARRSKDKPKKDESRRSLVHERPPPRKNKTLPNIQTNMSSRKLQERSSYFGVSPTAPSPIITTAATASRPRASTANQRPTSYYAPSASRPLPASARFWPHPSLGTSFPPQAPYPPPTASPYQAPYLPRHHAFPLPQPQPLPQQDYFSSQGPRLIQRPDYRRPTSALDRHAHSPLAGYSSEYDDRDDGGVLIRRPSLRTRTTRQEEDRVLMPPPRRPSTSIPTHSPFAPPTDKRRSISSIASLSYDDESVDGDSMYSASEQPQYDYRPHAVRRPSIDPTAIFDLESRHEQPVGRRSRRNSYYGHRSQSTEREVEDKMQNAQRYQARVDGPTDPLTLDSIRKISKTPSAGTRSNRGEQHSGYAPTNTNRTNVDNEDMAILIKGAAMLTIGNAQMAVRDGAEIRFPAGAGGGERSSRSGGGSDRASSTYELERERGLAAAEERNGRHSSRFDRDRERGGGRGPGRATSRTGSRGVGLLYPPPTQPPPTEFGGGGGYPQHYQQYAYAPPGSHPYPYPTHLNQF